MSVTEVRRRLARLFARAAFHLSPGPTLTFSTPRRIDVDYPELNEAWMTHVKDREFGQVYVDQDSYGTFDFLMDELAKALEDPGEK